MKYALGAAALRRIASAFAAGGSPLEDDFVDGTAERLESLELKARVDAIASAIADRLAPDYPSALKSVFGAVANWDAGDAEDPYRGFAAWPLLRFVATHGTKHPALSLHALAKLTSFFSAEFAIRTYIAQDPTGTMARMLEWTQHPDEHVRRLASEGSRPLLPWATRVPWLDEDPSRTQSILDALVDDDAKTVRTSVANHVNDLSKRDPALAIATCTRWMANPTASRKQIVGRALRTLVKEGHPGVWGLLGFTPEPSVEVGPLSLSQSSVALRDSTTFTFTLTSNAAQQERFVVDFAVHYMKSRGEQKAKVFKLRSVTLEPGESLTLSKKVVMMPRSTRVLYPGEHRIAVHINGEPRSVATFVLEPFSA